jgi:predicted esterase
MTESFEKLTGPHQGQPALTAGESFEKAQAALILVHRRGASAEDILGLAAEFRQPDFIALAPQSAGYTWYPNSFLAPIDSNKPEPSSGLAVIASLLAQVKEHNILPERTILLDFAQGAYLSLEFAASHARRYGGVVGLRGGLIGLDDTPRDYPGLREGTPAFLGCSDIDPHISKTRVIESAEILRGLARDVTCDSILAWAIQSTWMRCDLCGA